MYVSHGCSSENSLRQNPGQCHEMGNIDIKALVEHLATCDTAIPAMIKTIK